MRKYEDFVAVTIVRRSSIAIVDESITRLIAVIARVLNTGIAVVVADIRSARITRVVAVVVPWRVAVVVGRMKIRIT